MVATICVSHGIRTREIMKVEHLDGVTFGSVVTEIDLETLNNEEWDELYELWIERALLIFPEAFLSPEGQDEFAKRFGDLEFPRAALSNIGKDGKVHHEDDDEVDEEDDDEDRDEDEQQEIICKKKKKRKIAVKEPKLESKGDNNLAIPDDLDIIVSTDNMLEYESYDYEAPFIPEKLITNL